jgi:hypothetical protein
MTCRCRTPLPSGRTRSRMSGGRLGPFVAAAERDQPSAEPDEFRSHVGPRGCSEGGRRRIGCSCLRFDFCRPASQVHLRPKLRTDRLSSMPPANFVRPGQPFSEGEVAREWFEHVLPRADGGGAAWHNHLAPGPGPRHVGHQSVAGSSRRHR